MRAIELRVAHRSEFDFDNALWLIPEEQMKMCPPHSVPLSKQIIELLKELHAFTDQYQLAFPSPCNINQPMSEASITAASLGR